MTAKHIEKRLEQTLIHDEAMPYGLYKYELEEILDELRSSLAHDNDDYIFAVTENSGHVHIPSDLVVESCPHMLRAAQPLISRGYPTHGPKTSHKIKLTISMG